MNRSFFAISASVLLFSAGCASETEDPETSSSEAAPASESASDDVAEATPPKAAAEDPTAVRPTALCGPMHCWHPWGY